MRYTPADGSNKTKKDRQIKMEFGILYFYKFGARLSYKVKYKTTRMK